jgi:hypothetical protein
MTYSNSLIVKYPTCLMDLDPGRAYKSLRDRPITYSEAIFFYQTIKAVINSQRCFYSSKLEEAHLKALYEQQKSQLLINYLRRKFVFLEKKILREKNLRGVAKVFTAAPNLRKIAATTSNDRSCSIKPNFPLERLLIWNPIFLMIYAIIQLVAMVINRSLDFAFETVNNLKTHRIIPINLRLTT